MNRISARAALPTAAMLLAHLGVASNALKADDRDLLRTNSGNPFIMILLDNSGSMGLDFSDKALPLGADDPNSKFSIAKRAVYNALKDEDQVYFGFASYDQQGLKISAKHWLYQAQTGKTWATGVTFPTANDSYVFGAPFDPTRCTTNCRGGSLDNTAKIATVGTCANPYTLGTAADLAKLERFPQLGVIHATGVGASTTIAQSDLNWTTRFIVNGNGTKKYVVTTSRDIAAGNPNVGSNNVVLTVAVKEVDSSTCTSTVTDLGSSTFTMTLRRDFLFNETDGATTDANGEVNNGVWNYSDIIVSSNCSNRSPFSGEGWEGNYDGSFSSSSSSLSPDPRDANTDPYAAALCTNRDDPSTCADLKFPTDIDNTFNCPGTATKTRVLDYGDIIPLDWRNKYKTEFLSRLAPNFADAVGGEDFSAATYFADMPDSTGYVPVANAGRRPIVAAGASTFNKTFIDFRCFFDGNAPGNHCKGATAYSETCGWKSVDDAYDPLAGCRQPYVITISDAETTSCDENENFCADVSNLQTKTGVTTFGIILDNGLCVNPKNPVKCIETPGKGQVFCAGNASDLQTALAKILGQIKTQATAFASAAVPTVQATANQSIYVSNFTPVPPNVAGQDSYWDGHLNAFLRPLPTKNGKPDTTIPCTSTVQSKCFLWDAGAVLKTQVDPSTPVGAADTQRRVFYSRLAPQGTWTTARRPLIGTINTTTQAIRYDLWNGFGVAFNPDSPGVDTSAQSIANAVIASELALKTHSFTDSLTGTTKTITNILGDVFHSDPLVIDSPSNAKYYDFNLHGVNTATVADCTNGVDLGYQCFASQNRNRRKVLVVGSNDGMLHAFDTGVPQVVGSGFSTSIKYTNGTGKELWAYMPRGVMPTVALLTSSKRQTWTVDGPPVSADVFIDPIHTGTPTDTDRRWRTVLIGGLREGGRGYYALDVTQPDPLGTVSGVPYMPLTPSEAVPGCVSNMDDLPSAAAPPTCSAPYPAPLWEFYDFATDSSSQLVNDGSYQANPIQLDEDRNGQPDLGFTWSKPTIGRIKIADSSGTEIEKFVAVFGGGEDPSNKTERSPATGNWIYMVDIETGRAIYKRQVQGAVPSSIAAVDTDQNGYLDRLYFGTGYGVLYRVDLAPNAAGKFPQLVTVNTYGLDGVTYSSKRILTDPDDPTQTVWVPKILFDTKYDATTSSVTTPRPIYYEPTVIFIARQGLYGVAFGAGDREDLWSGDPVPGSVTTPIPNRTGRFYLFVDDSSDILGNTLTGVTLPYNESNFLPVDSNTTSQVGGNAIYDRVATQRGWFLVLNANERVTTDSFSLSGITQFSTFQPTVQTDTRNKLCSRVGGSRIFVVMTTNANGVFQSTAGGTTTKGIKSIVTSTFSTTAFAEQGQIKNAVPTGGTTNTADALTSDLEGVMKDLMKLFPRDCKFSNSRIDIKTIQGNTDVIFIAPIPICQIQKNWKEF